MPNITDFSVTPLSMIDHADRQRVDVRACVDQTVHGTLRVRGENIEQDIKVGLSAGGNTFTLYLPYPKQDTAVVWTLCTNGTEIAFPMTWKRPREWEIYVMISSHTDIGLHNSQYIQRHTSEKYVDMACEMYDKTADRPDANRYRYTMEGTWFWNNYGADRGRAAAERIANEYIKTGKLGVGAGIAGNHFHSFGLEEMCRSTYERSRLQHTWGVDSRTLCMIDNNGMPWSMVQPYADAGYQNIIFAPNQWNPNPSTIWRYDLSVASDFGPWANTRCNPDTGADGSRVDVRYDSALPMLYRWQGPDGKSELTVWASIQYVFGGVPFGFNPESKNTDTEFQHMDRCIVKQLPKMEARYPYDIWLLACYSDDQPPNLELLKLLNRWNNTYKYPQFLAMGNPDVPFARVREKYGDQIPVLRGEMTGGWYQHPLSAADILSDKLEADRRLANAETYATLAALHGKYAYPATDFRRAWDMLLWNDEHSYGTSGYQGRQVYETWMQHRDWVQKATEVAKRETDTALRALVDGIGSQGFAVFNPTAQHRDERICVDGREAIVRDVPPCGYRVVSTDALTIPVPDVTESDTPPTVENSHYRIAFAADGSMCSIFDKHLGRELLTQGSYGANAFVYTEDNHKTFHTPTSAHFTIKRTAGTVTVTVQAQEAYSGAAVTQTVTLDELHHRIDIDNRLEHVRAMINNRRYLKYIYFAFPFDVPCGRRMCQMNGCEAEYARDLTGHGTDTYMSAHEWCSVENDIFGAGLIQLDSLLIEFDHIHPDKTDCGDAGDGSAVYSYAANDWLQMHEIGGSHVRYRFRYAITSWEAGEAQIAAMAECLANPVSVVATGNGDRLPADAHSFLSVPNGQRLVALKRAEDGCGMIVRLYGERGNADAIAGDASVVPNTTDEQPLNSLPNGRGFATLRADVGCLPSRPAEPDLIDEQRPAPIGSVYTGLITRPMAARGEDADMLYLLWGQNMESNLSHYELHRSTESGFVPAPENLIAKVEPGEYRMARYIDRGLDTHSTYYYRVRAVNTNGVCGEWSEEFMGITKEPVE